MIMYEDEPVGEVFDQYITTVRGEYYFYEPEDGRINVSGVGASGRGLIKYAPEEALRHFKMATSEQAMLQAWRGMWAYVKYLVVEKGDHTMLPNKETAAALCEKGIWGSSNSSADTLRRNEIYWRAWNYYYTVMT